MFGSSSLDTAIGIIFIYLVLSFICTGINEGISASLNKRGWTLFGGIKNLLNDPRFTGLAQQVYSHGLVDGISKPARRASKPNRLPSYMSSKTFALALMDIVGSQGLKASWDDIVTKREQELESARAIASPTPEQLQALRDAEASLERAKDAQAKSGAVAKLHIEAVTAAGNVKGVGDTVNRSEAAAKLRTALAASRALFAEHPDPLASIARAVDLLPDGHTKESLYVLLAETKRELGGATIQQQIQKLQENIEAWFDDAMERVGGWYKRWTQQILIVIAVAVVLPANIDTIALANRLMHDRALREHVVAEAQDVSKSATFDTNAQEKVLNQLDLPLGWDKLPKGGWNWVLKGIGLLISIFAVSLGAPFWFDTLSKFINLRGAGTPPGERKKSEPKP